MITDGNPWEYTPDRRILPRIYPASGGLLDRGAFEWRCRWDLDGDGQPIGAGDLGVLLGAGGPCHLGCLADLDIDADIDASDLGILLGMWGGPSTCDEDLPAAGAPLMGFAMAQGSQGEPILDSPQTLAAMFGFEALTEFATWLATLSENDRLSVLSYLLPTSGGDL